MPGGISIRLLEVAHANHRGQTGHDIWKGGRSNTTPTFLFFFFGEKQKQEIPHCVKKNQCKQSEERPLT